MTIGNVVDPPVGRRCHFLRRLTTNLFCAGVTLLERGVKGLLPAAVVDGPENRGFVACTEALGPDGAIAFVGDDVQAVDNGHAPGEFAVALDFEEVIGLRGDDGRIQSDGHRYRIGQRNAVLAGLLEVSFERGCCTQWQTGLRPCR